MSAKTPGKGRVTEPGFVALKETYRRQVEWVNTLAEGMSTESLKETVRTMYELRAKLGALANQFRERYGDTFTLSA